MGSPEAGPRVRRGIQGWTPSSSITGDLKTREGWELARARVDSGLRHLS